MSANRASIDRVTNKDLKAHYEQFLLHFLQTLSQITNQGVIVLAKLRKMRTSKQKLNTDTYMQPMWCKIIFLNNPNTSPGKFPKLSISVGN